LSVAGTMPLAVSLSEGEDLGDASWSLLVRRSLLPGDAQRVWLDTAAITWRTVDWATFSSRTNDAVRFARSQYNNDFAEAMGRAVVYVDQTNDELITATLRELEGARGSLGAAIVEALRSRFLNNDIPRPEWDSMEARVDRNNMADDARLRDVFRYELQTLIDRFGIPRGIVQQGITL
jgi:hypothetical protein